MPQRNVDFKVTLCAILLDIRNNVLLEISVQNLLV